jgi:hypothetical protein
MLTIDRRAAETTGTTASPEPPTLHPRLVAALRHADRAALDRCALAGTSGEADELRCLAELHELWNGPVQHASHDVTLQFDDAVVQLKRTLEVRLLDRLRHAAADLVAEIPPGVEGMRRVAALDRVPVSYRWLETDASWAELVGFLTLEGGPDADFDDLVAIAQVGMTDDVKLALAENYWDEMGRGDLDQVHTRLHDRFVAAVDMPRLDRADLPAPVLARSVMNGLLSTNRWLQPELIGALGLVELQAGPRCRSVVRAMERLGAPADAIAFYEEHAEKDPIHGREWLGRVVEPLSFDETWARRMVDGAIWRHVVNDRFYRYVDQHLGIEPPT